MIGPNIDSDRKSFYAYARNRSRVRSTVGPLLDDQGGTLQHLRILLSHLILILHQYLQLKMRPADWRQRRSGKDDEKLVDISIDKPVASTSLFFL